MKIAHIWTYCCVAMLLLASGPASAVVPSGLRGADAPSPEIILVDGQYGACTDGCDAWDEQSDQNAGVDAIHGGSDEEFKKAQAACAVAKTACWTLCKAKCQADENEC